MGKTVDMIMLIDVEEKWHDEKKGVSNITLIQKQRKEILELKEWKIQTFGLSDKTYWETWWKLSEFL